ncbi:MAG: methylated-DNA--[protein]-cysteine S-methyltransferase [Dehalococcoidia bacterium]|nr:MAG: methylated-DNA--[protein]-cysteine S-methyltransferase [Dehalococcoidia bacterium]
MEWSVVITDMGWVVFVGSERGLARVSLPHSSIQESLESLGSIIEEARFCRNSFGDLSKRLRAYFSGYRISFTDELDFLDVTHFQKKVWQATKTIPYGETRSYGWLANRIGQPGAGRAVGQALARNRLPIIIPCHRVVSNDNNLVGFSGGLTMKKRLLHLETTGISLQ